MKARDLIDSGETILVVFTRGAHFDINWDNNTGKTGEWDIDPNHSIDRVIIYYRDEKSITNKLYIANCSSVEPANRENRQNIRLAHIQYIGSTSENWHSFAEAGANPVRYLSVA